MSLKRDEIIFAYRLFLDRQPSEREVERMSRNVPDWGKLRQVFIGSREFSAIFRKLGRGEISSRPTLIHLHVPKTGGSSLNVILKRTCGLGEYLSIDHGMMDSLRSMDDVALRKVKIITGHMLYGVDRLIPQPSIYLCLLRPPAARILSFYRYVLRTSNHPLHEECRSKNMSFGDFLCFAERNTSLRVELDNGQIRRIAGRSGSDSLGQEGEIYEQAMVNIFSENMLFGLMDHFDDFIMRLKERKLIPDATPARVNVSPEKTGIGEEKLLLGARERRLLEGYTEWDQKIYDLCARVYLHTSGEMRASR